MSVALPNLCMNIVNHGRGAHRLEGHGFLSSMMGNRKRKWTKGSAWFRLAVHAKNGARLKTSVANLSKEEFAGAFFGEPAS